MIIMMFKVQKVIYNVITENNETKIKEINKQKMKII